MITYWVLGRFGIQVGEMQPLRKLLWLSKASQHMSRRLCLKLRELQGGWKGSLDSLERPRSGLKLKQTISGMQ